MSSQGVSVRTHASRVYRTPLFTIGGPAMIPHSIQGDGCVK